MKKKISTGLIATGGDGLPCVHPPMPANWCHVPEADQVKDSRGQHSLLKANMSSEHTKQDGSPEVSSLNGAAGAGCDSKSRTNNDELENSMDGSNSDDVEVSRLRLEAPSVGDGTLSNLYTRNSLNPPVSEDSNVDVETEDQSTRMINGAIEIEPGEMVSKSGAVSDRRNSERHALAGDREMSDPHYIEKQVVQSFLTGSPSGLQTINVHTGAGLSKVLDSMSASEHEFYKLASRHGIAVLPSSADRFSVPKSVSASASRVENSLDAVSMTIANVAAGEGDPPEFLTRDSMDKRGGYTSYQGPKVASPVKQKKIRNERDMSASARLPVISSLLAPSHTKSLPGIHHIASAHGKAGNHPTTVLPSVAHFLGPAKSPPVGYIPQKITAGMFGSSLPSTSADDAAISSHTSIHYQTSSSGAHTTTPAESPPSAKSKGNRKPVTPAGLRLSMAASEELPDPLPIPQYSDKVIRAKQLGTVTFDRPTVLRETVQFFLQFKHYWSSHDYDRISNLVVELFPEFKDNSDTPCVPANKRIRTDLSMYARNFRRREVSQRKRDSTGSAPDSALLQKSESSPTSSHEPSSRSFIRSASLPSNGSMLASTGNNNNSSGSNPSDFCNELLTAASIIESQNTGVANRNGDGNIGSQNHHKVKIAEPGGHGSAMQKHEVLDEEDRFRGTVGNSNHHMPQEEKLDEEEEEEEDDGNTPLHFIYDKDAVSAKDVSAAWQTYSEQMAQALAAGNSDYVLADQAIKKDLGTCARNMRRRLPTTKYKPVSSSTSLSSQKWGNSHSGLELQISDPAASSLAQGTAEYMKALMAAQNMNLTELGVTQRNLGELAVLAGIKQKIEQHPQEVTDLERQYLAQCSSEEQRQALIASGAFGSDVAAMSALSAYYGLGIDVVGPKKVMGSSEFNTSSAVEASLLAAAELDAPSKRQRRISQAEVEKRLREAELIHNSMNHEDKSDSISVDVSDRNLVKREPMSPTGRGGLKTFSSKQHLQISSNSFPSTSVPLSHDTGYWDTQGATNLALASMAHPASHQMAMQAHSQAQIQHLPGHDPLAHPSSAEAPMNLTYHESDKHVPHKLTSESPLPDSLPVTAGLAAQVEVTTSPGKSQSPRRRASSSQRSSHRADPNLSSKEQVKQVWFPHGSGFKKESQEVVSLPEPLPVPSYSQKILSARDEGSSVRHRSEIIRETARHFLVLKYWWSSSDYTKISELVVQQFPDLKDDSSTDGMTSYRRIQRDLSMCARNLRRSKKPRKMRDPSTSSSSSVLNAIEGDQVPKKLAKTSKSATTGLSNTNRKSKKPLGSSSSSSSKPKKPKTEPTSAVDAELSASAGISEEMTAAVALLQQQYMQSSSSSPYHPSSHLLSSSHLLPPLHTHPALHDHLQQQHHHQLQEEQNFSVEQTQDSKRLLNEEVDVHEPMEHHPHSGVKSRAVIPMQQRSATPTAEDGQVPLIKSDHGHIREVDGAVLSKDAHDKVGQQAAHLQPASNMKVYADPDHGSDLQERFSTLWRKGKFFDASLGVANRKLHVHKLVLLAMSPYLQETFKNADPRSQLEVNLPSDTTYETAKAFLKYIYDGILEVDTSSVRSLHKIATMLQMTKLAQFCQNFAQQLQEEVEQANRALQRLGEVDAISSSDVHRTQSAHYVTEEHAQLKEEYLGTSDQASIDQTMGGTPHYMHQDVLPQHPAFMASSSSSLQPSAPSLLLSSASSSQDAATQQLIQAALARHQGSSLPHSQSSAASIYQHHPHAVAQSEASAALLHRLASPDSSSVTALGAASLDHQQRLSLAAYWQAHTFGELISRNQATGLTSDPSTLTSASELAAIAAAATTTEDTRRLLTSTGQEKSKSAHSRGHHHHQHHHSKEASWSGQGSDSNSGSHATMLPETCLPHDMARSHCNNPD